MRRRWLLIPAGLLLVVLLALALLPWWAGVATRLVASRYGATFSRYERIGYTRFALREVQVRRPGVVVSVSRVEADTPVLWALRHGRGAPTRVVGGEWRVEVSKREGPPSQDPSGWLLLRARLKRIAAALDRWLPEADVGAGSVAWPGAELRLGAAHWSGRTLAVRQLQYRQLAVDGTVGFAANDDTITVALESKPLDAHAKLESRADGIRGEFVGWAQPVALEARFRPTGWMPEKFSAAADRIALPGERLKLGNLYSSVDGRARVDWDLDHFNADIALRGAALAGAKAPPFDVTLRGRGDTRAFTMEALHATVPGASADLSAPVTIDRAGKLAGTGAVFSVRADLAQQQWFKAAGTVSGEARVGGTRESPVVDVVLDANALRFNGADIPHLRSRAKLEWPVLTVSEARMEGASGDGLAVSGTWNFRESQINDAKVRGSINRATLGRWIPASIAFGSVSIDAQASGPIQDLVHRGRVQVSPFRVSPLAPGSAELQWEGRGPAATQYELTAIAGEGGLHARGAADANGTALQALELSVAKQSVLALKQPAKVTWRPSLGVEELHLVGPDASVDASVTWGDAGRVGLAIRGLRAQWIRAFTPLRGPDWQVSSLALTGTWDRGPLDYSTAGELLLPAVEGRSATVNIAAHGNGAGLVLDALHVVESGKEVANASGRFPVKFAPRAKPALTLEPGGRLELKASTVPNAAFWQQLAAISGLELRSPEASVSVGGTWSRPVGEVRLRAERAAMDPKRFNRPLPSIDGVDIAVLADSDGIKLERFSFSVERQPVRATGRLPVSADTWGDLMKNPVAFLQRGATLRLEIPDAEVAMFSRFLPAALAPAGRLQADVRFERGALGGFLTLRDAASKPLGPLGVLQDVNARVEFADQRVVLQKVSATSGGQPVAVTGSVELPRGGWGRGDTITEPRYDIALRGTNLPFVRQAGLLVRGDLDLRLRTTGQSSAAINGKVVLRDSLFLTDVRAMIPRGGGASPSRRPPYFAVETPPLNGWTLDIEVTGDRFMRIRTPVFVGVASTRFRLGGTLGEPRAIGDATIDEGQVLMPFASFQVQQGAVRLTEESPYEPTIFLRGAGRHYGYDLSMEVSGKASAPSISFTSSPALDSEQVLLMVMTGAAPSNEVNTSLTHRAVQFGAFFGQNLFGSLTGQGARPDRLSVESGEKISRQGKETYSIEYKLNGRWSVTGEYDEFDEYNAGFKWRVAPRKAQR